MDNPTEVFDATYKALEYAGVDDQARIRTLERLAGQLIENWPQVSECAARYGDDPVAGPVFQKLGLTPEPSGTVEIRLYVHDDPDESYDQLVPGIVEQIGWPRGDERYYLDRLLYEVALDVEVDRKSGASRIVGVEGTRLVEPLAWNGRPSSAD